MSSFELTSLIMILLDRLGVPRDVAGAIVFPLQKCILKSGGQLFRKRDWFFQEEIKGETAIQMYNIANSVLCQMAESRPRDRDILSLISLFLQEELSKLAGHELPIVCLLPSLVVAKRPSLIIF